MLVSGLAAELEDKNVRSLEVAFADISLSRDASTLTLATGDTFPFDEQLERSLCGYLGINRSYVAKCPSQLKAANVNYWLTSKPDAVAVIEAVGDAIVHIHKPGLQLLPLSSIVNIVTRTFKPECEVVNIIRDDRTFHLDIRTDQSVTVRPDSRIEGRNSPDIPDVTYGGVRILANPIEPKPPLVLTYLHRPYCTNGSVSAAHEGTVNIKGVTVEDVEAEIELRIRKVMSDMQTKLAAYGALADRRPPGTPMNFADQLGREYKLTQKVRDRIKDNISQLPGDATLYDVQQVFTQLANGNVNYRIASILQHLGGDLAFDTDHVVRRCVTCERLLPDKDD